MYTITCPICGNQYQIQTVMTNLRSFYAHMKTKHDISRKDANACANVPQELIDELKASQSAIANARTRTREYIDSKNARLLKKVGKTLYESYPHCAECGLVGSNIYGHVKKVHGLTPDEYLEKYNKPLASDSYLNYLSESRTGENNPQYGNGKSENSPFSPEFYIIRGYNEEDAVRLAEEKKRQSKESLTPDKRVTRPEYYMAKFGVSQIEAEIMVHERQKTNSVESIARREGINIEEAQKVRDLITRKWVKTLSNKSQDELNEINRKKLDGNSGVSGISQSFFTRLIEYMNIERADVWFGENEKRVEVDDNGTPRLFMVDFCYGNKIIEFNGDVFHANPELYGPADMPLWGRRNILQQKTAKTIWDYDDQRLQLIVGRGYKVLVIWEKDVKESITREIERCAEFLIT